MNKKILSLYVLLVFAAFSMSISEGSANAMEKQIGKTTISGEQTISKRYGAAEVKIKNGNKVEVESRYRYKDKNGCAKYVSSERTRKSGSRSAKWQYYLADKCVSVSIKTTWTGWNKEKKISETDKISY